MNQPHEDSYAPLRRSVYSVLIVLSTGVMLGRILAGVGCNRPTGQDGGSL